jgi:3'-phosphoadenosine 5'-phosphosulfate sulfotransferase (PAPS reductase)/FAD synthetase
MIDVMSFGGGVQSTAIMTLACEGLIPMPAHWVFSDPQFESELTYAHLERCKEYLTKHGTRLDVVTAGSIREDAVTFAQRRANSDVKRYASIPMFIQKRDGTDGILPRQCTTEYKIEPIEEYHRYKVLGLKYRQRAPKEPAIAIWIGISADEERRASPPGRWKEEDVEVGKDLLGEPVMRTVKRWLPVPWQHKAFPLLGYVLHPDRSRHNDERFAECAGWDREDALNWLAKVWPHPVPRSACICCPYRTNAEWRQMRESRPEEFAQAVEFDATIRAAYAVGRQARGELAGVPYLHRTRVPLAMADLDEPLNDRMGCGGLFSTEPDGICGV